MRDINTLEADSVRCSFDGRDILTDVYLKCETGDIIGLLGRNGTGKSTLLKIIFGSQDSENNNIRYNHKPFQKNIFRNNLVAYLPQHNFLPPQMKVRNLVKLFLGEKNAQKAVLTHKIVSGFNNQKIDELSGGERRLLEFLILLHSEAQFLLLDEPFSAIEPLLKEEIKIFIKQNRTKKGFIITDHDYRHVLDICNEFLLIDNGVCRHLKDVRELEFYNYVPLGTFE